MPPKKLSPNAPCPCDSGKEYGDCCHDKGFDWMVDEDGNIGRSVPVSDELAEVIKQQHQKFVEEFGREPGPEDNLFFNMPRQEVVEHVMVEGMKQAGLDPAIIYAFEKTGLTRIIHEVVVYSEKWLRMAGTDGVWGCGCE